MNGKGAIRQGDVLLVPMERLGPGALPIRQEGDSTVLAAGEATGYAHTVLEPHAQLYIAGPWVAASRAARRLVVEGEPATLVHEEHDPIAIPPGVYSVRRQREYVPEEPPRWTSD